MADLIRLREVSRVGSGPAFVWRWGPDKKTVDSSKDAPLPPIYPGRDPHGWWIVAPDPGQHAPVGGVRACSRGGMHEAIAFVPECNPNESFHHGRDARCRFCEAGIPIGLRGSGKYDAAISKYTTRDGAIRPGCYFWMFRAEAPTSKESIRFLDKQWKNHQVHLIVCLPDGNLWDTCASMEEDGSGGWSISGELPNITTTPSVRIDSWQGRIQEGVIVDEQ